MRIITYIIFLCAVPVVSFGQTSQIYVSNDSCDLLVTNAESLSQQGQYEKSHQAYRYYIESCAKEPNSYRAFSSINATNSFRGTDPNRYIECRDWLKGVLYLSPDSTYYCEDVNSIIKTFYYYDSVKQNYLNGSIAIIDYLLEYKRCPYLEDYYINIRKQSRDMQIQRWKDTVHDSLATPLDTAKPTLEDLNLGILRGPTGSVAATSDEPRLGELIATRNPFTDILELKYRLDKSAMVRIDVYDLLGRAVYSEGQGYKAEGEHVLSLQSNAWASGSYYVRLSSPSGEVKTVKVVKE